MRIAADLTGQTFGRLTVIGAAPYEPRFKTSRAWICRCTCGTLTRGIVTSSLLMGYTTSCGCRRDEVRQTLRTTHGQSGTLEHTTWKAIRQRCHNPKCKSFKRYGARGIVMCKAWRESFEAFFADMGRRPTPQHSIERKDNDGHYEPSNCMWATKAVQARNRRNNVMLEFQGERMTATDWALRKGWKPHTLLHRLKLGWSVERALTEPLAGAIAQLEREHGFPKDTLHRRLSRGWTLERALATPVPDPHASIGHAARQHGLRPILVYSRLALGWTLDRALTTPVRGRRR